MWGINGLSAPGQVEPWPATPHCVVPACTVGWTRTPLTWFSASRDFLLPRGPNAAWAGAHPTAGEKPQAAPTLLRGSKGSEGKKQGLFHTPCLLPDLQDHLQFPGSKIQGLHRRRGSGGGGGGGDGTGSSRSSGSHSADRPCPSPPHATLSLPGLQVPHLCPQEVGPQPAALSGGVLTGQPQEAVPVQSDVPHSSRVPQEARAPEGGLRMAAPAATGNTKPRRVWM